MTNSDSLFDDISKLLSVDNESTEGDSEGSPKEEPVSQHHELTLRHPYMALNEDGVPVIVHELFSTFFPASLYEAMKEEAKVAHEDVANFIDAILTGDPKQTANETTGLFTTILTGEQRVTGKEAAIWVARLTMVAAAMASVSMIKGLNPNQTGQFLGATSINIAAQGGALLRIVQTLAAPIRAEWGIAEGGEGHELH